MSSRGEEKIMRILSEKNIPFQREYSFKNLLSLSNKPLRFDFYINLQEPILIDYDGQQHFESYDFFFKSSYQFRNQVQNDERKNAYCIHNNICFLRIPYWDYDILSLDQIFHTPEYRVKTKDHNRKLWESIHGNSF